MTQIIAAITQTCAYLVADRRLTYGSGLRKDEVFKSDECKVVSLCHVNAIGYTGLAKLGGIPTNEWIATELAKANCLAAGPAAHVLASHAPAALPPLKPELRRLAFLICGWAPMLPNHDVMPHIGLVSNFHNEHQQPKGVADDKFEVRTRILQGHESAALFAIGEPLDAESEARLLRSIRRVLIKTDAEAIIMRLLAEEVFRTSARSRSVGDEVQACCIPVASATGFFTNGYARMSGVRALKDRSTFGFFDRNFNEFTQFGPTFVLGGEAFTEIKYERSRTGPETSMSFRVLYSNKGR